MIEQLEMQTDRLLLRPLKQSDFAFIFDLVNTKQWLANIGDRNVRSVTDAQLFIQRILANPNIRYCIFETNDQNIPIGIITLIKRDYLTHWDLGFALLPAYTGQGFALEASNAVLKYLSKDTNVTKLFAITLPENSSSVNLLTKLGFFFEKELARDGEQLHLYALSMPPTLG
jgi:[ribosomal protein S5]-alanine N-acetyltransferase